MSLVPWADRGERDGREARQEAGGAVPYRDPPALAWECGEDGRPGDLQAREGLLPRGRRA